ncbi:LysR family transcriptional regulator [Antrihabitans spumae]|uniref:LysR family transcriptional regulator n=1 Tax=Antrihabitans spumae TaxID=3373370 RepID=A0ABW7K7Z6_9NOCA
MDVSSRRLRYFVAVAEELHFSRAAARLFVAQQALSKQIRELEDDLGAQLLRRTTRSVELTPAGELFLETAREMLATLDAGVEATRRAALGESGVLRLGFLVGAALELTAPILEQFAEKYPDVRVELREFGFNDPAVGLGDGTSDLAFLRLPTGVTDIDIVPLFVEPCVLAVPSAHRLAGRKSVAVDEMLDEPMVVARTADDVWQRFWTLDAHRGEKRAKIASFTNSHTEEIAVVSAGVGCSVMVAGAARHTPHSGVRYVPIDGFEGSVVALGWPAGRRSVLADRFVQVALDVRDRETDIVSLIEHPFEAADPEERARIR